MLVNNPTRSVARGIVESAPQVLLPVETSFNYRGLRISGEMGYWFTNKDVPNSWIQGVVAGHEFQKDRELYLEVYDQHQVRLREGQPKLRETTLGVGGRTPVVAGHWLRLIGMAGHGLIPPTVANGQPGWIAYVGVQFLSDRRRRHGDELGP